MRDTSAQVPKTSHEAAPFDLDAFSGPFRAESDRACAVLGGALLETKLKELFLRRLSGPDSAKLLNGALGSFGTRIQVARALSWIDEFVQHDLERVQKIRNRFAHEADHTLSFSDATVTGLCEGLEVAKVLIEAHDHLAKVGHANVGPSIIRLWRALIEPPRARFEVTVQILAQHLIDLPAEAPEYRGPSLRNELWTLGTTVFLKASVTAKAGPPEPNAAPR